MKKVPRNEQETIILYDVEADEWEVYTNYPPHIRRYRDKVTPEREEFYKDGTESVLEGVINGSVGVRGKPNLSAQQRKEMADRLAMVRASQD